MLVGSVHRDYWHDHNKVTVLPKHIVQGSRKGTNYNSINKWINAQHLQWSRYKTAKNSTGVMVINKEVTVVLTLISLTICVSPLHPLLCSPPGQTGLKSTWMLLHIWSSSSNRPMGFYPMARKKLTTTTKLVCPYPVESCWRHYRLRITSRPLKHKSNNPNFLSVIIVM